MPLHVRDLRALEGPNLYYPQPAVKLQVWADRDLSRPISDTLKTWAQATGVVIGALRQDVQPADGGFIITTTWTTPLPTVGERIAEGIVADLQAAEQHDEEYSHDDLLFEVMDEHKRQRPSLKQLQLYAEAQFRDVPMLPCGNGKVMLGTGARGWIFDPAVMSLGMSVDPPWDQIGTIPVVAVTGTNGKTTTTRLIAHVLEHTGQRVGRTDTDGIIIGGQLVEEGDWAGFGGARRVLTDPDVDVAVLETSRGGILRRGLGFPQCDVSVVTNISADHLGELDISTPEEMADVKSVIVMATSPDGAAVLNADDPLVLRMRERSSAPLVLFSRDPDNAAVIEHLESGGAVVRSDGARIEAIIDGRTDDVSLTDVPITVGGAALHNVENVLAATAACLSLSIDMPTIAAALRTFTPDSTHNANRLNIFERDNMAVVFDYAHNEAGMAALLRFGQALQVRHGGRLLMVLGGPGDRTDEQIRGQGQLVGAVAEAIFLHEEERYLRGRELGETTALYREGATAAGLTDDRITLFADERAALDEALAHIQPGDVLLVAAHAHRDAVIERLQQWATGTGE